MYGANSFSLTQILSGISKGLGLVNKAIPIYKEIKPMVRNAHKLLDIAKEFNINITNKKKVVKENTLQLVNNTSNPTFFQ